MTKPTIEEVIKEFTDYLRDWAIIEPELSLILGNVRRMLLVVTKDHQAELEQAVKAERERIIKEVMLVTSYAEDMSCMNHLPCKDCVVHVRQAFLDVINPTLTKQAATLDAADQNKLTENNN